MEKNDQQSEIEAILKVIANESTAFWNKDFEAWAQHWVHASYIRSMGGIQREVYHMWRDGTP